MPKAVSEQTAAAARTEIRQKSFFSQILFRNRAPFMTAYTNADTSAMKRNLIHMIVKGIIRLKVMLRTVTVPSNTERNFALTAVTLPESSIVLWAEYGREPEI